MIITQPSAKSKHIFQKYVRFHVDKRKYVRYNTYRTNVREQTLRQVIVHAVGMGTEIGMREQKNIYEMTDRELRAYKRKLRRQRERRAKIVSMLAALCLIIACVISYHSLTSSAKSSSDEVSLKYYTGVIVQNGDSLWSIADKYIDYQQYRDKAAYIEEVCSINNLSDESDIRAGQRLVVPYYSSEFVK